MNAFRNSKSAMQPAKLKKRDRLTGELLLRDFLRKKDIPPWFRGTSIFHLQGTDQLFRAIRDDLEQRTSHRVKTCLYMIGLEPLPSSRELKFLMLLSRGNDLAFLWFLMEWLYKTPSQNNFSLNEQLICSSICHLDMITTLRELDRILPLANEYGIRTNKVRRQGQRDYSHSFSKTITAKTAHILPYFEKIQRPQPYGKSLTLNIPHFKVQFNTYSDYADPNHVVQNECNRWYAEYDFHPGRRVAFNLIQNAVANIFENLGAANIDSAAIKSLCGYHKALKQIEEQHRCKLKIMFRDKCLRRYFSNCTDTSEHSRRIKETIDAEIKKQMCSFRYQTKTIRRNLIVRTITSGSDQTDAVIGNYDDKCANTMEDRRICRKCHSDNDNSPYGNGPEEIVVDNLMRTNLDDGYIGLLLSGKFTSQMSLFAKKYLERYDYGYEDDFSKQSQMYFHSPTTNTPYFFDYRKIFLQTAKHNSSDEMNSKMIKKAFLEALDKDIATLNELGEAKSKLYLFSSESACRQDLTSIGVKDKALLDKMLFESFQRMQKNPKFVLAQLPNAHKLPMLREWIARRFGKVYSARDRRASFRYSLRVFHALDNISFDFPTPTTDQLGQNKFINYNCKDYLGNKVKYIKERFYSRLENAIMKQSRTYWLAIRGYLCSGTGPPRQTFFAYMPSHIKDIQRFRLWKLSEHRPYKAEWDKRRLISKRRLL
ncbi:uncharacterized protein LOC142237679 isoform X2 [Haematobia irritans]|uniref:uncharacterized protein LOC142237679 isoform X2 n=1 Tax=Haematobia irritans TaxID=7368 RepID=UPI003F4FEFBE